MSHISKKIILFKYILLKKINYTTFYREFDILKANNFAYTIQSNQRHVIFVSGQISIFQGYLTVHNSKDVKSKPIIPTHILIGFRRTLGPVNPHSEHGICTTHSKV